MPWKFKRNREQILGMLDLLDFFEDGQLPLHRLVDGLSGKHNGMYVNNSDWDSDYESYWFALEIENAFILSDLSKNKAADIMKASKKAMLEMRQFLLLTLNEFPTQYDDDEF